MSNDRITVRLTKFQEEELTYLTSLVNDRDEEIYTWIWIGDREVSIAQDDLEGFKTLLEYRIDGALDNFGFSGDMSWLGYANSFKSLLKKFN